MLVYRFVCSSNLPISSYVLRLRFFFLSVCVCVCGFCELHRCRVILTNGTLERSSGCSKWDASLPRRVLEEVATGWSSWSRIEDTGKARLRPKIRKKKKVFEITWSGWRPSHILYIFLGWSRFDFVFWGVVGPTLGAAIGQLLSDESSCRRCSKRILCLRVARSCKKVILEGRFFSASLADVSCITTVRSSCVVGSKKTPGDRICLFLLIF